LDESRIGNYKTIVVPFALSMSDDVADALIRYVENGGNVILEGGCGRLNEIAYSVRGLMNKKLRDVLEIKVKRHILVREPEETDRWSQTERTWGEYEEAGFLLGVQEMANCRLRANIFVETYEAVEQSVCFTWGKETIGVSKKIGEGKIYLIGTALGPSATAYIEEDSSKTLEQLLSLCDVQPIHVGKLLVQKRIAEDKEAWFITNPHKEAITERIILPKDSKVSDLLGKSLEVKDGMASLTVESLDVRVLIVISEKISHI
jgi:beta-galactosidase GanA